MKLVQLNIWQGRFIDQVNTFLKQEQPDIICLQEVYNSKLTNPLLPFFGSLERIQAVFPDYYVFFSPTHQMNVLGEPVAMGNAILSRLPLSSTETIFINGQFHEFTTSDELQHNTRNLQRVQIMLPDSKQLTVINHHGYWEPNPIGSEITMQKMQLVADIVKSSSKPVIFTGDLNISYVSPAMEPLQALLTDLTQKHQTVTTLSQFGKVKDVPCDHICISDGVVEQSFTIKEDLVSDHLPLVLEFDLS